MALMTVGPVIGKVTGNSGRVLVELDAAGTVRCRAVPEDGGEPVVATAEADAHRPVVIRFDGLAPATRYGLEFEDVDWIPPASLTTLPSDPTALNCGVVSCNLLAARGDSDLWEDLWNRYVKHRELDLLLHAGDQVYGDMAFTAARRELERGGEDAVERATEHYRGLYRQTWTHEPTRQVLANIPNLMIWDDHEIRDDWASRQSDRDPETLEHRVGKLARRAYHEYQRQLWDDVSDSDAVSHEGHIHVWGELGFLFIDQRGARAFSANDRRPYLGVEQWEEIETALGDDGILGKVRALVVVSSVPLAFLGDSLTRHVASHMDDLRDHWCFPPYIAEQIRMMRRLRTWKQGNGLERELLVVGGDVHIGMHTEIRHKGERIFNQLITSPITNRPPKWTYFYGMVAGLEAEQRLGDNYSFEHSRYTNRRNFGIILMRCTDDRHPMIEGSLFRSD